MDVSNTLGHLSNHLEAASELGVGPAQSATSSSSASSYHMSPTVQSPIGATSGSASLATPPVISQPMPGLLPSLPVDQPPMMRRLAPINTAIIGGVHYLLPEPATADFTNSQTLQPPPLLHSHSFPNGHQLPSQLHGLTPSTPMVPSPSFTSSLGIPHAPVISSPLATMPVSRAPSPPQPYPMPEQAWAESATETMMLRTEAEVHARRPSSMERRPDGRPVVMRSRSTSVNKNWNNLPSMTASVPPSTWHSRQVSPSDEEEDDSEEEEPRRVKRRRSSAARDDPPDPGYSGGSLISDDIRRQLDQVFEEFLNRICSDRELLNMISLTLQSMSAITRAKNCIKCLCQRRWHVSTSRQTIARSSFASKLSPMLFMMR